MEITRDALARVACNDAFSSLSVGAQALYFRLVLTADSAGVVLIPKCLERFIGAPKGSLAELETGGYIALLAEGGCEILKGKPAPVQEKKDRERAQTRERVRRYRERKRVKAAEEAKAETTKETSNGVTPCNADVTPALAPSFLPPSSPSLPFPTPLSNTPPISPLKISSTPIISSSSLRYAERVQAMAKHFWDRSLHRYELQEILWLADRLVHRRGVDEEMGEDDMELLEVAFMASAEAGACSIAYLRGVYANWHRGGILTSDEYWENEVRRDGVGASVGSSVAHK